MGNKEKEKLLMIRFKEGNASGEQLVEYSEIAPETIGPNMTKDVEDAWTKEGWNDALTNLINNGLVVFTFSDAFECIYGLPENIPENIRGDKAPAIAKILDFLADVVRLAGFGTQKGNVVEFPIDASQSLYAVHCGSSIDLIRAASGKTATAQSHVVIEGEKVTASFDVDVPSSQLASMVKAMVL